MFLIKKTAQNKLFFFSSAQFDVPAVHVALVAEATTLTIG